MGTFRNPTSEALQRFTVRFTTTNIRTDIGDKVYSVIYYSHAKTYPDYNTICNQMINLFEVVPSNSSAGNATSVLIYGNRNYG